MKTLLRISFAALLAAGASAAPTASAGALDSGLASSNVEYLKTIPIESGTWTTAKIHGDYLYASGTKSFSIYDISDPETPLIVSHTPTGAQFINEDIDTNGEILLVTDERLRGVLQVWDVSNKQLPSKLAEVPDMIDHSFACVFDCKWAYGAGGDIVDLRDPANPKAVSRWTTPPPGFWGFDTTEVRPGMVVTGSQTIHFLDGRRDPAKPKTRALAPNPTGEFLHSIQWPSKGRDRFLLAQTETSPKPQCDERSGAFLVYDTRGWQKTHSFKPITQYRVPAGTYVDGRPPVSALGCSATWFKPHPSFRNGGLVAAAFFDHGTLFLRVDRNGEVSEAGYFMPLAGSTTAALWASDEIVYAIDIVHGIDVLRFTDEP